MRAEPASAVSQAGAGLRRDSAQLGARGRQSHTKERRKMQTDMPAGGSHRPWWPQHGLPGHLPDQDEVAGRRGTQQKPGVLCQFGQ